MPCNVLLKQHLAAVKMLLSRYSTQLLNVSVDKAKCKNGHLCGESNYADIVFLVKWNNIWQFGTYYFFSAD